MRDLDEVRVDGIEGDELKGWVHATCLDQYLDDLDDPSNAASSGAR
jgi:hypothetical protein